ncbi:MAG: pentapeptide repeat-containing protein, partial [Nocardioides sp.]
YHVRPDTGYAASDLPSSERLFLSIPGVSDNFRPMSELVDDPRILRHGPAGPGITPQELAPSDLAESYLWGEWGIEPGKKVVYLACRLEEAKGIDKAIEAVGALGPQQPGEPDLRDEIVVLVTSGDREPNEYAGRLTRLAGERGVDFRLRPFTDQNGLIQAAVGATGGVFVLASVMEPFGMTPMEAGKAGVAVVASRHAGCAADFLKDREHALIADPHDAREFGAAIREVLTDDELRERLVANNIELTRNTTWTRNVVDALTATRDALRAGSSEDSAADRDLAAEFTDWLDHATDPTEESYARVRTNWLIDYVDRFALTTGTTPLLDAEELGHLREHRDRLTDRQAAILDAAGIDLDSPDADPPGPVGPGPDTPGPGAPDPSDHPGAAPTASDNDTNDQASHTDQTPDPQTGGLSGHATPDDAEVGGVQSSLVLVTRLNDPNEPAVRDFLERMQAQFDRIPERSSRALEWFGSRRAEDVVLAVLDSGGAVVGVLQARRGSGAGGRLTDVHSIVIEPAAQFTGVRERLEEGLRTELAELDVLVVDAQGEELIDWPEVRPILYPDNTDADDPVPLRAWPPDEDPASGIAQVFAVDPVSRVGCLVSAPIVYSGPDSTGRPITILLTAAHLVGFVDDDGFRTRSVTRVSLPGREPGESIDVDAGVGSDGEPLFDVVIGPNFEAAAMARYAALATPQSVDELLHGTERARAYVATAAADYALVVVRRAAPAKSFVFELPSAAEGSALPDPADPIFATGYPFATPKGSGALMHTQGYVMSTHEWTDSGSGEGEVEGTHDAAAGAAGDGAVGSSAAPLPGFCGGPLWNYDAAGCPRLWGIVAAGLYSQSAIRDSDAALIHGKSYEQLVTPTLPEAQGRQPQPNRTYFAALTTSTVAFVREHMSRYLPDESTGATVAATTVGTELEYPPSTKYPPSTVRRVIDGVWAGGSQAALARELKVKPATVARWVTRFVELNGDNTPPRGTDEAPEIERWPHGRDPERSAAPLRITEFGTDPYSGVVKISFGRYHWGTGILIGKGNGHAVIATAAHVLFDPQTGAARPVTGVWFPGREPDESVLVKQPYRGPRRFESTRMTGSTEGGQVGAAGEGLPEDADIYSPEMVRFSGGDIAVLHVAHDAPPNSFVFDLPTPAQLDLTPGDPVLAVGYPLFKGNGNSADPDENWLESGQGYTTVSIADPVRGVGMLAASFYLQEGQSGGPLISFDQDGSPVWYGITSVGDDFAVAGLMDPATPLIAQQGLDEIIEPTHDETATARSLPTDITAFADLTDRVIDFLREQRDLHKSPDEDGSGGMSAQAIPSSAIDVVPPDSGFAAGGSADELLRLGLAKRRPEFDVNPLRGTRNCASAAFALERKLAGVEVYALDHDLDDQLASVRDLYRWYGMEPQQGYDAVVDGEYLLAEGERFGHQTHDQLLAYLSGWEDGEWGLISVHFGDLRDERDPEGKGHPLVVRKHHGEVQFLDGKFGMRIDLKALTTGGIVEPTLLASYTADTVRDAPDRTDARWMVLKTSHLPDLDQPHLRALPSHVTTGIVRAVEIGAEGLDGGGRGAVEVFSPDDESVRRVPVSDGTSFRIGQNVFLTAVEGAPDPIATAQDGLPWNPLRRLVRPTTGAEPATMVLTGRVLPELGNTGGLSLEHLRAELPGLRVRLEGEFVGADLSGWDLRGADLSGAVLLESHIKHADLRGATLAGARLGVHSLDGVKADWWQLRQADIRYSDLEIAPVVFDLDADDDGWTAADQFELAIRIQARKLVEDVPGYPGRDSDGVYFGIQHTPGAAGGLRPLRDDFAHYQSLDWYGTMSFLFSPGRHELAGAYSGHVQIFRVRVRGQRLSPLIEDLGGSARAVSETPFRDIVGFDHEPSGLVTWIPTDSGVIAVPADAQHAPGAQDASGAEIRGIDELIEYPADGPPILDLTDVTNPDAIRHRSHLGPDLARLRRLYPELVLKLNRASPDDSELFVYLDLHGADLRAANLSRVDLTGSDLRGADLRDANLRDAVLGGADLGGADLRGADLSGVNLSGTRLRGADLTGVVFRLPGPQAARGRRPRPTVLVDERFRSDELVGARLDLPDIPHQLVAPESLIEAGKTFGFWPDADSAATKANRYQFENLVRSLVAQRAIGLTRRADFKPRTAAKTALSEENVVVGRLRKGKEHLDVHLLDWHGSLRLRFTTLLPRLGMNDSGELIQSSEDSDQGDEPLDIEVISQGRHLPLLVGVRDGDLMPLDEFDLADSRLPVGAVGLRLRNVELTRLPVAVRLGNLTGNPTGAESGSRVAAAEFGAVFDDLRAVVADPERYSAARWRGRPWAEATVFRVGESPLPVYAYLDDADAARVVVADGGDQRSGLHGGVPLRQKKNGSFLAPIASGKHRPLDGLTLYRLIVPSDADLAVRHADSFDEFKAPTTGTARVHATRKDGAPVSFTVSVTDGELVTEPALSMRELAGLRALRYVRFGHGTRSDSSALPAPSDLADRDLSGANLAGADLAGQDLSGANLSSANLSNADVRGADLRSANLWSANLTTADLRGADLRGADLRFTDLRGADLRGADVRGANLAGTQLAATRLRGADLFGVTLWTRNSEGQHITIAGSVLGRPVRIDFSEMVGARLDLTGIPYQLLPPAALIEAGTTFDLRTDDDPVAARANSYQFQNLIRSLAGNRVRELLAGAATPITVSEVRASDEDVLVGALVPGMEHLLDWYGTLRLALTPLRPVVYTDAESAISDEVLEHDPFYARPIEIEVISRGRQVPVMVRTLSGSAMPLDEFDLAALTSSGTHVVRFDGVEVVKPATAEARRAALTGHGLGSVGQQVVSRGFADVVADLVAIRTNPGRYPTQRGLPPMFEARVFRPGEPELAVVVYLDEKGAPRVARPSGSDLADSPRAGVPLLRTAGGRFLATTSAGTYVPLDGVTAYKLVAPSEVDLALRHAESFAEVRQQLQPGSWLDESAEGAQVVAIARNGAPVSFRVGWRNGALVTKPRLSDRDLGGLRDLRFRLSEDVMVAEPTAPLPTWADALPYPDRVEGVAPLTAYRLGRPTDGQVVVGVGRMIQTWSWRDLEKLARAYFEASGMREAGQELRINLAGRTAGQRPRWHHVQLAVFNRPDADPASAEQSVEVEYLDERGEPATVSGFGRMLLSTAITPKGPSVGSATYGQVVLGYYPVGSDGLPDPAMYAGFDDAPDVTVFDDNRDEDVRPPTEGFAAGNPGTAGEAAPAEGDSERGLPGYAAPEYADPEDELLVNSPTRGLEDTGERYGRTRLEEYSRAGAGADSGRLSLFRTKDGLGRSLGTDGALREAVVARLAKAAGVATAEVEITEIEGRVGSLQTTHVDGVEPWPFGLSPASLTAEEVLRLQIEQVFDWLIGNNDIHLDNFLRLPDGRLVGIDREMAFRDPDEDDLGIVLDLGYLDHQVYARLWAAYVAGEIEVHDPASGALAEAIARMAGIDDEWLRDLLTPYARNASARGRLYDEDDLVDVPGDFLSEDDLSDEDREVVLSEASVHRFLDSVVRRKNRLAQDFGDLFAEATDRRAHAAGIGSSANAVEPSDGSGEDEIDPAAGGLSAEASADPSGVLAEALGISPSHEILQRPDGRLSPELRAMIWADRMKAMSRSELAAKYQLSDGAVRVLDSQLQGLGRQSQGLTREIRERVYELIFAPDGVPVSIQEASAQTGITVIDTTWLVAQELMTGRALPLHRWRRQADPVFGEPDQAVSDPSASVADPASVDRTGSLPETLGISPEHEIFQRPKGRLSAELRAMIFADRLRRMPRSQIQLKYQVSVSGVANVDSALRWRRDHPPENTQEARRVVEDLVFGATEAPVSIAQASVRAGVKVGHAIVWIAERLAGGESLPLDRQVAHTDSLPEESGQSDTRGDVLPGRLRSLVSDAIRGDLKAVRAWLGAVRTYLDPTPERLAALASSGLSAPDAESLADHFFAVDTTSVETKPWRALVQDRFADFDAFLADVGVRLVPGSTDSEEEAGPRLGRDAVAMLARINPSWLPLFTRDFARIKGLIKAGDTTALAVWVTAGMGSAFPRELFHGYRRELTPIEHQELGDAIGFSLSALKPVGRTFFATGRNHMPVIDNSFSTPAELIGAVERRLRGGEDTRTIRFATGVGDDAIATLRSFLDSRPEAGGDSLLESLILGPPHREPVVTVDPVPEETFSGPRFGSRAPEMREETRVAVAATDDVLSGDVRDEGDPEQIDPGQIDPGQIDLGESPAESTGLPEQAGELSASRESLVSALDSFIALRDSGKLPPRIVEMVESARAIARGIDGYNDVVDASESAEASPASAIPGRRIVLDAEDLLWLGLRANHTDPRTRGGRSVLTTFAPNAATLAAAYEYIIGRPSAHRSDAESAYDAARVAGNAKIDPVVNPRLAQNPGGRGRRVLEFTVDMLGRGRAEADVVGARLAAAVEALVRDGALDEHLASSALRALALESEGRGSTEPIRRPWAGRDHAGESGTHPWGVLGDPVDISGYPVKPPPAEPAEIRTATAQELIAALGSVGGIVEGADGDGFLGTVGLRALHDAHLEQVADLLGRWRGALAEWADAADRWRADGSRGEAPPRPELPSERSVYDEFFGPLAAGSFGRAVADRFVDEVRAAHRVLADLAASPGSASGDSWPLTATESLAAARILERVRERVGRRSSAADSDVPRGMLVSLPHPVQNRAATWAALAITGAEPGTIAMWVTSPHLAQGPVLDEARVRLPEQWEIVTSLADLARALEIHVDRPVLAVVSDNQLRGSLSARTFAGQDADADQAQDVLNHLDARGATRQFLYVADLAERLTSKADRAVAQSMFAESADVVVALNATPVNRDVSGLRTLGAWLGVLPEAAADDRDLPAPVVYATMAPHMAVFADRHQAPTPEFAPVRFTLEQIEERSRILAERSGMARTVDLRNLATTAKLPVITNRTVDHVRAGGKVAIFSKYRPEGVERAHRHLSERAPHLRTEVIHGGVSPELRRELLDRFRRPADEPDAIDALLLTYGVVEGDTAIAADRLAPGGYLGIALNPPTDPADLAELTSLFHDPTGVPVAAGTPTGAAMSAAKAQTFIPFLERPADDSGPADRHPTQDQRDLDALSRRQRLVSQAAVVPTATQRARFEVGRAFYGPGSIDPAHRAQFANDFQALEAFVRAMTANEIQPAYQQSTRFFAQRIRMVAANLIAADGTRPSHLDLGSGLNLLPMDLLTDGTVSHAYGLDVNPVEWLQALTGPFGLGQRLPRGILPQDTPNHYLVGLAQDAPQVLDDAFGEGARFDLATASLALTSYDPDDIARFFYAANQVLETGGRFLIIQPLSSFDAERTADFHRGLGRLGFSVEEDLRLVTQGGDIRYLDLRKTHEAPAPDSRTRALFRLRGSETPDRPAGLGGVPRGNDVGSSGDTEVSPSDPHERDRATALDAVYQDGLRRASGDSSTRGGITARSVPDGGSPADGCDPEGSDDPAVGGLVEAVARGLVAELSADLDPYHEFGVRVRGLIAEFDAAGLSRPEQARGLLDLHDRLLAEEWEPLLDGDLEDVFEPVQTYVRYLDSMTALVERARGQLPEWGRMAAAGERPLAVFDIDETVFAGSDKSLYFSLADMIAPVDGWDARDTRVWDRVQEVLRSGQFVVIEPIAELVREFGDHGVATVFMSHTVGEHARVLKTARLRELGLIVERDLEPIYTTDDEEKHKRRAELEDAGHRVVAVFDDYIQHLPGKDRNDPRSFEVPSLIIFGSVSQAELLALADRLAIRLAAPLAGEPLNLVGGDRNCLNCAVAAALPVDVLPLDVLPREHDRHDPRIYADDLAEFFGRGFTVGEGINELIGELSQLPGGASGVVVVSYRDLSAATGQSVDGSSGGRNEQVGHAFNFTITTESDGNRQVVFEDHQLHMVLYPPALSTGAVLRTGHEALWHHLDSGGTLDSFASGRVTYEYLRTDDLTPTGAVSLSDLTEPGLGGGDLAPKRDADPGAPSGLSGHAASSPGEDGESPVDGRPELDPLPDGDLATETSALDGLNPAWLQGLPLAEQVAIVEDWLEANPMHPRTGDPDDSAFTVEERDRSYATPVPLVSSLDSSTVEFGVSTSFELDIRPAVSAPTSALDDPVRSVEVAYRVAYRDPHTDDVVAMRSMTDIYDDWSWITEEYLRSIGHDIQAHGAVFNPVAPVLNGAEDSVSIHGEISEMTSTALVRQLQLSSAYQAVGREIESRHTPGTLTMFYRGTLATLDLPVSSPIVKTRAEAVGMVSDSGGKGIGLVLSDEASPDVRYFMTNDRLERALGREYAAVFQAHPEIADLMARIEWVAVAEVDASLGWAVGVEDDMDGARRQALDESTWSPTGERRIGAVSERSFSMPPYATRLLLEAQAAGYRQFQDVPA